MPGPDILFVITQSISQGKKSGIMIALGLCTGLIVHTMFAAFGLALLLYKSGNIFQIIKYSGAVYLIYLGITAIINRKKETIHLDLSIKKEIKHLYLRGFLMNILNPKVSFFFIAFLPQFVDPESPNASLQMFFLGFIFISLAIMIFSLISVLADVLAAKFVKNQKISMIIVWIKAIIFLVIGIKLALSKFN